MAIHFDIIISMRTLFNKMLDLKLNEIVDVFIEYRKIDDPKIVNYRKVDLLNFTGIEINKLEYKGLFIISKEVDFGDKLSPYDDDIFPYTIEIFGGRETDTEIEKLKFRQIAKKPSKGINKAYQKLQRHLKKTNGIEKGANCGKHFYKNIYRGQ